MVSVWTAVQRERTGWVRENKKIQNAFCETKSRWSKVNEDLKNALRTFINSTLRELMLLLYVYRYVYKEQKGFTEYALAQSKVLALIMSLGMASQLSTAHKRYTET